MKDMKRIEGIFKEFIKLGGDFYEFGSLGEGEPVGERYGEKLEKATLKRELRDLLEDIEAGTFEISRLHANLVRGGLVMVFDLRDVEGGAKTHYYMAGVE